MLNYEFPPIGGGGGQAHLALLQQYASRDNLDVDVLTSGPALGVTTEQFAEHDRLCAASGYDCNRRGLDVAVDSKGRVLVLDLLLAEVRTFERMNQPGNDGRNSATGE